MASRKPIATVDELSTWPDDLMAPKTERGRASEPLVSSTDVSDTRSENELTPRSTHQWQPGRRKRMPLLAVLSLSMTLVLSGTMIAIVLIADGTATLAWKVSPTVLAAIVATAANILIQFALAKGIAVSWWRRSIEEPTSIRDLHARWAVGQGFFDAAQELLLRGPNIAAIASVMATLVAVNSPLIQRAIVPGLGTYNGQFDLGEIRMVQQLPRGYSGFWDHQTKDIEYVTQEFSDLARAYLTSPGIVLANRAYLRENLASCDGTCAGKLKGAGFAADCEEYSLTKLPSLQDANGAYDNSTDIFLSALEYREYPDYVVKSPGSATSMPTKDTPRTFTYKAMWTQGGCPKEDKGITVLNYQCTLRPAIIEYDVVVVNGTLSLDPDRGIWSAEAVSVESDEEMRADVDPDRAVNGTSGSSTYGGIASLLVRRFSSRGSIKLENGTWKQDTEGLLALESPMLGLSTNNGSCPPAFADPGNRVMRAIGELMFRASVEVPYYEYLRTINTNIEEKDMLYVNDKQRLKGEHKGLSTIYIANYQYLYAAVAVTILAGLLITPLFYGFWNLGRQVSMSPLEVAKAFDPPQLREAASNSDAKALLGALGNKQVNYGVGNPRDKPHSSTLVFMEAEIARRPKPGMEVSM